MEEFNPMCIKKERCLRNITQVNLSKMSGVPRLVIIKIEKGYCVPNIDTLNKLLTAMNLTLKINGIRKTKVRHVQPFTEAGEDNEG